MSTSAPEESSQPGSSSSSEASFDSDGFPKWKPHALPDGKNADGRPMWEPPILDYSDIIGEVFDKKREAVLKYLKGDVVKTTEVMDKLVEEELMDRYCDWSETNKHATVDPERQKFFSGLWREIYGDWYEDSVLFSELNIIIVLENDGTWVAMNRAEYYRWRPENDPRYYHSPPQSDIESPTQYSLESDSDFNNTEDGGEETSSHHTSSSAKHTDNDEPASPSQDTTGRSRLFQQPQAPPTRMRSLSPNWKQPALAFPPHKAKAADTRPLALRLVGLKSSVGKVEGLQMESGGEDDVD